jgi:hypothetical protein
VMAEGSLPGTAYERLLWRKLTLRFDSSEAATDPKRPFVYFNITFYIQGENGRVAGLSVGMPCWTYCKSFHS